MRVKEKPYPLNHGVDVASVVSPNKRQIQSEVSIGIEVEPHNQVLDLSKPSEKINGYSGTTETDAIHRRLGSLDGGVENLAKSVVDLMESSSAGGKRKRSPAKISPSKNVKDEAIETGDLASQSGVDGSSVKKELFQDIPSNDQEIKKAAHSAVVNSEPKGKKKSAIQQGKKTLKKKKNVKKKCFTKDDDDFQIDPRLGGTKIRQSIGNKGKDKKLKSTDQEPKKQKTLEQRCPYVHIEGSWNLPSVVKIVNGHVKEDENDGKSSTKLTKAAQYIDEEHRNKVAKVGFTSTLSDRYDTHNRDATWVCVFCQLFTHTQCLGDLYGPYYINQVSTEPIWFSKRNPDSLSQCNSGAISAESEFPLRPNVHPKKTKKSPKKKSLVKDEVSASVLPSVDESATRVACETPVGIFPLDPSDEKVEVWFHESCLIWAPGVCLVPPRLVGLDEAVSDSQQVVCEYCKKRGGHIFCRRRGCGLRTHFPCAIAHGWLLREETFMALCPTHLDQAAIT